MLNLREVSELFKTLKPLKHEDRERLWARLDTLYKEDRERGEKRRAEQEVNASKIRWEISQIEIYPPFLMEPNWKKVWEQIGKVSGMFKRVNLSRTEREDLWGEFNGMVAQVKERQNSEKSGRENMSREYKGCIFSKLKGIIPDNIPGISDMALLLTFGLTNEEDTPELLKDLGRWLSEASELLSEHKKEMTNEHKQECFQHIKEAYNGLGNSDRYNQWIAK